MQTNGGYQESNMKGVFRNLGLVWFNRNSIANILALADVRKVCRVTLDTMVDPVMRVHRRDGSIMKFTEQYNTTHGLAYSPSCPKALNSPGLAI